MRGVLARPAADGITALALHWRSLAADREATVGGWAALCEARNRDKNRSFQLRGWEDEAHEPTVRVIEAIWSVLERAGARPRGGMSLPDPATVRAFALAFELATRGNARPAVDDFAGSLEGGPGLESRPDMRRSDQ